MAGSSVVSRGQGVFALILPLAVLVGYLLADPSDFGSIAIILFVVTLLCVPILIRWHHPLLILAWNAAINPYFLPGRPYLWMIMTGCSLFFSVLTRIIEPERRLNFEPALARPLFVLVLAVIGTGLTRGGFGAAALGSSSYGGKAYFYILFAVGGYFALSNLKIPQSKGSLFAGLFFLSGLTAMVPNMAYAVGSSLNFLFYLFPPEFAMEQAAGDWAISGGIFRVFGLTAASTALLCFLLVRYGLRGILTAAHPVRFLFFVAAWAGCIFCGFRSVLILFVMVCGLQFWLEGLFRSKLLPILLGISILVGAVILPNTEKLPLVVQRTISFLPVELDNVAKASAQASLEWRLEIWRLVMAQVPQYLLVGKGYAIDPTELNIAAMGAAARGSTADQAILAGDYHSGPLSLLVPLGIWGALAMIWFWAATARYLIQNYRFGDPALKGANTFLLVLFLSRLFFFLFIFGGFYTDLYYFTGIAGLSVALNGRRNPFPATTTEQAELEQGDPFAHRALNRRFY